MNKSLASVLLSILIVMGVWVGLQQFHAGHLLIEIVKTCETDLTKCQADLAACQSKPVVNPPPGPIIVLDPTKPTNAWTINSFAATCVAMTAGYTNEDHIGVGIERFDAELNGFTQPQAIKKLKATFHDNSGNHTLIVLRTSLDTLVWKLDGNYLLPEPRNSDLEFPQEWCGSFVTGTTKVVRSSSPTDTWLDPGKVTIVPTLP